MEMSHGCDEPDEHFGYRRSSKRCHWCLKVLKSRLAVCVVVYWLVVTGGGQGCTGATLSIFFFSDGEIDEVLKCRWKKSNHDRGHWQGNNCCGCCHPGHGCRVRHRRTRPQEQVPRTELLVLEQHTRPREQVDCGFQPLSVEFLQQLQGIFIDRVHYAKYLKSLLAHKNGEEDTTAMLSQAKE